MEEGH